MDGTWATTYADSVTVPFTPGVPFCLADFNPTTYDVTTGNAYVTAVSNIRYYQFSPGTSGSVQISIPAGTVCTIATSSRVFGSRDHVKYMSFLTGL